LGWQEYFPSVGNPVGVELKQSLQASASTVFFVLTFGYWVSINPSNLYLRNSDFRITSLRSVILDQSQKLGLKWKMVFFADKYSP